MNGFQFCPRAVAPRDRDAGDPVTACAKNVVASVPHHHYLPGVKAFGLQGTPDEDRFLGVAVAEFGTVDGVEVPSEAEVAENALRKDGRFHRDKVQKPTRLAENFQTAWDVGIDLVLEDADRHEPLAIGRDCGLDLRFIGGAQ